MLCQSQSLLFILLYNYY